MSLIFGVTTIESAMWVADALRVNSFVRNLNIGENSVDALGAKFLADALRVNLSITDLDLHRIILVLWVLLRSLTSTPSLNLKGNQLGDVGAASLADALHLNSSVTFFNLSLNQIV